jgi:hypothetical protein
MKLVCFKGSSVSPLKDGPSFKEKSRDRKPKNERR